MFRFVHAADLHLDSPFSGLLKVAPEVASSLQEATFDAYEKVIDLCLERKVDALLVAGDVFDSADRSLKAQLRFVSGLERLTGAGIRAFICHGNHDPLDGWEPTIPFPEGAHRFKETVTGIPVDPDDPSSPVVCGISYPTPDTRQNLVHLFPEPAPGRLTVGLLHANVGADTGHDPYAPCSLADLEATGYDYWALGHVHTRRVLRDQAPAVVYPGNVQGRHPNEAGARGVYLVELSEGGDVRLEFVPVDVVRWERVVVPIDSIPDDGALRMAVERAVEEALTATAGRALVYRLELTGRGHLHQSLSQPGYLEDLHSHLNEVWVRRRPFALCGRIDDLTRSVIDREELLRGQDFLGDFLRLVDEVREDEALLARLRTELRPLYEHVRARRYLRDDLPSPERLRELLAVAEDLALAGLLDGDRR